VLDVAISSVNSSQTKDRFLKNPLVDNTEMDSLPQIIRKIPKGCLFPKGGRSFSYLVRDFVMLIVLVYAVLLVDSWLLGPLLAILVGFCLGGLFVLGHDCGHRSFHKSEIVNNFVGHLTTSVVLWPFHVWRLDHDIHHKFTCHIDKDSAWRPITFKMYNRMPRLLRMIYLATRSEFFFLGSIYTTYTNIKEGLNCKNSRRFPESETKNIRFSLWVILFVGLTTLGLAFWSAKVYGLVCLFLIPQLVFHSLLSMFTFFHHTTPDRQFLSRHEWSRERAQLLGSLHVRYPKFLEFFVHDINWHVPHHVCVGIPHYHLRHAHQALWEAYPGLLHERRFGLKLIREVTSKCHFVKSKYPVDLSWVSVSEARGDNPSKACEPVHAQV
jgi:acyl-lipid omega-6 desaturase (Delta-12 desaturase)